MYIYLRIVWIGLRRSVARWGRGVESPKLPLHLPIQRAPLHFVGEILALFSASAHTTTSKLLPHNTDHVDMLDVNDFITERGGNPELIRESQRRRFASVEVVDEVIALFEDHRRSKYLFNILVDCI